MDDRAWVHIVKLNFAYTYYPTYAEVVHAYDQSPTVPVFAGKANYENEDFDGYETGGPYVLRLQEYWTMTSGATGLLYGNHNTWDDHTNWRYESTHRADGLVARRGRGVEDQVGVARLLVRVGHPGEALDQARARLGVQALAVARLADLHRGGDVGRVP
jgi:hypothetical protein